MLDHLIAAVDEDLLLQEMLNKGRKLTPDPWDLSLSYQNEVE